MTHNRITQAEAPAGMYKAMLNSEHYVRTCGLDHRLLELIKVRASQLNGCGFCLDMHHKDALEAGETMQRLYLLPAWEESPVYSESEKAALNLTEVLTEISTKGRDVDDAFNRAAKFFEKDQIANLVMAICQINSWNRIAVTFGNVPGSYKLQATQAVV